MAEDAHKGLSAVLLTDGSVSVFTEIIELINLLRVEGRFCEERQHPARERGGSWESFVDGTFSRKEVACQTNVGPTG